MCWTVKNKPNRLIAENDIPVFKIGKVFLNVGLVFPYFFKVGIAYEEGLTYNVRQIEPIKEGILTANERYIICRGLHSYNVRNIRLKETYKYAETFLGGFKKIKAPCVQITTLRTTPQCTDVIVSGQAYEIENAAIILCYIPKNTAYYINDVGEMVSERIKVSKIFKTPFTTNKDGSTSIRSVDKINKILNDWENGKI